jgi:hypothetical protein
VYTLYCGIASLPIPYGVKEEDVTSILECLADCDADPECGAALFIDPICYYSETTSSSSTISSSSSSEVPPVYEGSTT